MGSAALVTAIIVIFSILVIRFEDRTSSNERDSAPLAPSGAEVAVGRASVAVLYMILWLVFALAWRSPGPA